MAKSGKMKIVQVNSSLIKKDSICNIILASHNVFASAGLDSKIVVDTISEYNDDFIYPLFLLFYSLSFHRLIKHIFQQATLPTC